MSGLAHYNTCPFSGTAGEALEADRLVMLSAGTWIYTDAAETATAITLGTCASGDQVSLWPIQKEAKLRGVGLSTETADAIIYTAADGKIADTAGGGSAIGVLLSAITAALGKAPMILNRQVQNTMNVPMGTIRWMEDFTGAFLLSGGTISETDNQADWLKTSVDGSAGGVDVCKILDDAPGGILQLTCNAANADAEGLQLIGESFKPAVGKKLYFEARFGLLDVDKCDFFIGLCISDTTILGGASDRIGFQNLHTGTLRALTEQDTTEKIEDTGATLADCSGASVFAAKSVKVSFYWDGVSKLTYAVNGVATNAFTDNGTTILVPDDEVLTPSVEIMTHTGAAAVQTAFIDYMLCIAER